MQQGAGRRVFLRAPSAPPSHRPGAGRRCASIGAVAWAGRCRNRISRRWGSPTGWGGPGLSAAARTLVLEARACNLMCPAATRPKSMHAAFESARTSEIEQNRESRFAWWPPRVGVLCATRRWRWHCQTDRAPSSRSGGGSSWGKQSAGRTTTPGSAPARAANTDLQRKTPHVLSRLRLAQLWNHSQ